MERVQGTFKKQVNHIQLNKLKLASHKAEIRVISPIAQIFLISGKNLTNE